MKIDIVGERYNPFMKRKELIVEIENPEEPTPSKAQLAELLTKHIQEEAERIDITKILSSRGNAKSKAWVFVWDEKRVIKAETKTEKTGEENKAEAQPASAPAPA
jgi:ribosomal protein S24E